MKALGLDVFESLDSDMNIFHYSGQIEAKENVLLEKDLKLLTAEETIRYTSTELLTSFLNNDIHPEFCPVALGLF